MHDTLSIIGREVLRIVLPSWCTVCEAELPWRDRTASCCGRCWRSLRPLGPARCRSCALPLPGGEGTCIACSVDPLPVEWCEAWGEYDGGLERLLHAFKFERSDFLDRTLASLLAERLLERADLDFDAIVPVPMHWSRERARGYNQAALLGAALAGRIGIACRPGWLSKSRRGFRQSRLPRAARRPNVRHSFRAHDIVSGKSILLVDDICTTGETLRACASELLRNGVRRVCAITVAKAV